MKIPRSLLLIMFIASLLIFSAFNPKEEKENIRIVFNSSQTKKALIELKKNLKKIHNIDLNYQALDFSRQGNLISIKFVVDCNDGFAGTGATSDLAKSENFGFERNYSNNASAKFKTGFLNNTINISGARKYFLLKDSGEYYFFKNKDYTKAAKLLKESFEVAEKNYKGFDDTRYNGGYNAACAYALAGNIDSAFAMLQKIVQTSLFDNYALIANDNYLSALKEDSRWKKILDDVKANKIRNEIDYDKNLIKVLSDIRSIDQGNRERLNQLISKHGNGNSVVETFKVTMREKDSINLIQIRQIISEKGWLGPEVVGAIGVQTQWLVIQHADLKTQIEFLPVLEKAAIDGKLLFKDLAFLKDRIALRHGKKQLYGSQLVNIKGKNYPLSLESPQNIENQRSSVWLESMSSYLGRKWDLKEYLEMLPVIEQSNYLLKR